MSIKPEQVIIKKEKDHPNASAHAHFTSKDDCITLAFNILVVVKGMKNLKGHKIDGHVIEVDKTEHVHFNPSTSIFIKNLNENVSEKDLIELFKKCGFIVSCMVLSPQIIFFRWLETKRPKNLSK